MRFLLSIHDVWPGNYPRVEDHLARLRGLGAGPAALLVVPEYHGSGAIHGHAEFLAWLGEKRAAGSEVFLHGCRHWMPERAEGGDFRGRRSAWGRWINGWVAQEAEFCGLDRAGRSRLLERGVEGFRRAGLPLQGFVAPTWHGAPPPADLRGHGIGIWETRFYLRHLPSGKSRFAPPLAWSQTPRGPVLAGGASWRAALLRLPLIKIALHPGDLPAAGVERTLVRALALGRQCAYAEVFAGGA